MFNTIILRHMMNVTLDNSWYMLLLIKSYLQTTKLNIYVLFYVLLSSTLNYQNQQVVFNEAARDLENDFV